mgnify:CR=1 FL=1
MNTELKKFQRNKLWYAICSSSLVMTWLMTASVVQASDLQIYAVPKAGKKTIIMMLDTSGSMGYGAGYNSGNTSGFGIYDDYDRVCSGLKSITSSTSYANGKLYSVQSTTTPNYSRNFCYISASSAREVFDTNRKYAVAILEHFDSIKLTKRVENDRVLY